MQHEFANLMGRQAVVTGASSGIGRAIAVELAQAHADVLIHYAHESRTSEVMDLLGEIAKFGENHSSFRQKFVLDTDYELFVSQCLELVPQADIWINNAGADLLTGAASRQSYAEKLSHLYSVDIRSSILLTKVVGQKFRDRGRGVIINIGWDQADRGMEGDSGELFAASKNAIMGATRSLAISLAPEVRVLCVAPGWIKTAWGEQASSVWQQRVMTETPLKRWGKPEDIAKTVRFLVSEDASYLTGQVINVNGGAVR